MPLTSLLFLWERKEREILLGLKAGNIKVGKPFINVFQVSNDDQTKLKYYNFFLNINDSDRFLMINY